MCNIIFYKIDLLSIRISINRIIYQYNYIIYTYTHIYINIYIYIIDKNTSKYSTDIFNMNTILFKYINDEISPILSLLFNRCINEGLFPDEFKKAKIKPLYKSN